MVPAKVIHRVGCSELSTRGRVGCSELSTNNALTCENTWQGRKGRLVQKVSSRAYMMRAQQKVSEHATLATLWGRS